MQVLEFDGWVEIHLPYIVVWSETEEDAQAIIRDIIAKGGEMIE